MTVRVGINGFGRIGRNILRSGWNNPNFEFVHINDLTSNDMLAYLLTHDSVHGNWDVPVTVADGGLLIGGRFVPVSSERDPSQLPWGERDTDIVLECTGVFRSRSAASAHLDAGCKRVIISAPGQNVDATFVYGVNHTDFDPAAHVIVSNASCTTNCLAPVAKVLHETVGIEHGCMTTVHAYTMDQNLLDAPHRGGNFRRARAAAVNMVPTSTGAAKAIALVLPELGGLLHGMAVRVPTPDGSLVDLTVRTKRDTTVEEIAAAMNAAADGPMAGVLEVRDESLVSSDIIGNPASSIVDIQLTNVQAGRLLKIVTWYDNEWGFSNRMLDLARYIGGAIAREASGGTP
jgi:glyceraldehyde 3-phosphate dehydrogenase